VREGPARPRAIVFDWDNTLVDTWPTIHHALQATLEAMGHELWSLEETTTRVRQSLRDVFPKMFGDRWEEARKVFYEAFERTHIENLEPIAGAAAMLQSLKGQELYLAVVSNKTGHYLRKEAEHLGWDGHFARLVGAGDAERDKPEGDALWLALEGSAHRPGPDIWFAGDAGIDMEIAHRTGCVPVLLHRKDTDAEEFDKWPPALIFGGCASLTEHIKGSRH
jgi:phosphoglycolate phosphatase